jgi:hypothetical protein
MVRLLLLATAAALAHSEGAGATDEELQALREENARLRSTIANLRGEVKPPAPPAPAPPRPTRKLPLLFMNLEDITDTTPQPPPAPPPSPPPNPPPPSYTNHSWFVAKGVNANGPNPVVNATKTPGSEPDAGACERTCALAADCTVYTWNLHSGHCYHRTDSVWTPSAVGWAVNYTVSGCLRAAVPGCGAPAPPAPPAPPPAPIPSQRGRPSLIYQVANPTTIAKGLRPPPFDYSLCTIIAAPCISGAFEVLGHPGLFEVFLANASTFSEARASSGVDLLRYTTSDFVEWSHPEVVMHLLGDGHGQQQGEAMVKGMARNDATGEYLAAMWVGEKLTTYSAVAKPGETLDFKVVVIHPFKDKDDLNLIYDNARQQWVDMQIHMVQAELQYCGEHNHLQTVLLAWLRFHTDGAVLQTTLDTAGRAGSRRATRRTDGPGRRTTPCAGPRRATLPNWVSTNPWS